MNTRILMLFFLAATSTRAQQSEFVIHPNGLIYSESTMASLHRIVDSMNLRFKKCEPWKEYRALSQAIGHFVELDTGDVVAAKRNMEAGISFEEFRRKYSEAEIEDSLLVLREVVESHSSTKSKFLLFYSFHFEPFEEYKAIRQDDTTTITSALVGKWAFQYQPKGAQQREAIKAFYFPLGFNSRPLTYRTARAVQYVDCMIDTSGVDVFFPAAREIWEVDSGDVVMPRKAYSTWNARVKSLGVPDEPKPEDFTAQSNGFNRAYDEAFTAWHNLRLKMIRRALKTDASMREALKAVAEEAQRTGNLDAELEGFADEFLSREYLLMLKRSRIAIGECSQDDAPREHAHSIARLAAETINWELFLRAHLDILNDNFERLTDGSYARSRRQTYLRELEALNFDVVELMMGTTYRMANPSGNHYFGSIPRQGRALADYSNPEEIEARMAADIADTTLDDYNRMMVYYLFESYVYHCGDGERGRKANASFRAAAETLPAYLRRRLRD